MRTMLEQVRPVAATAEAAIYSAADVPTLPIDKLVYFCASVIWRASLRDWLIGRRTHPALEIGRRYEEEIRLFLLGQTSFPQNAAVAVNVSRLAQPLMVCNFPDPLRADSFHAHRLCIPGVNFVVMLGKHIPEDIRQMCILRGPLHPIVVSDQGDAFVHTTLLALTKKIRTPRYNESV